MTLQLWNPFPFPGVRWASRLDKSIVDMASLNATCTMALGNLYANKLYVGIGSFYRAFLSLSCQSAKTPHFYEEKIPLGTSPIQWHCKQKMFQLQKNAYLFIIKKKNKKRQPGFFFFKKPSFGEVREAQCDGHRFCFILAISEQDCV